MNRYDFKRKLNEFFIELDEQGLIDVTRDVRKVTKLNQKIDNFTKELDLEEKDALTLQEKLQTIATLTTSLGTLYRSGASSELKEEIHEKIKSLITDI